MIIGLSGLAGSGKSTAAEYLARRYGFVRTRFAAPLKAMLRGYLSCVGVDPAEQERMIEGDLKEVPTKLFGGKSPRYVMVTLGTEWGRDLIAPHFWTDAWELTARRALKEGHPVCVEDCRFPNEADAIRRAGGFILKIKRPGLVAGSHVSEAGVEPDCSIWNDGPVDILAARLDGIIDRGPAYGGSTERRAVAHSQAGASV